VRLSEPDAEPYLRQSLLLLEGALPAPVDRALELRDGHGAVSHPDLAGNTSAG
jgi:hypothetical protein